MKPVERLQFVVEGSQGDEYRVIFNRIGDKLNAYCNCQAGLNGQYCKHRLDLMDGEIGNLLSLNNEDVERLRDLMAGTKLEVAYRQFIAANQLCEAAKQRLAAARKELAREMHQ